MMKNTESKMTKAQIVKIINDRQLEALEMAKIFRKAGKVKMATMYEGEVAACSTILFRIAGGK